MIDPPIRLAPYAALPNGQMLWACPPSAYPSMPPGLHGFRPAHARRAREMLALFARGDVACPAEAVMRYRDAIVLDGKQVLSPDRIGVGESYDNTIVDEGLVARQRAQLARIAAGEVETLPESGPPVVALFQEASGNFGHLLVEVLPRLLHLAEAGIRRMRLLLPTEVEPLRPVVDATLAALGLQADCIPCPELSILRVAALHWVSPVARHEHRKSPTLLRLAERLRPAATGPRRLYLARPRAGRRPLVNAAEVEAIAAAAGYAVVEPSRRPFLEQLALLAGAERVIGPMGAALTLGAFMPPGGRMAMLEAANCDPFFWDLACLCGHRFDWAFTAPVDAYRPDMLERPMIVPLPLLHALIDVVEEKKEVLF